MTQLLVSTEPVPTTHGLPTAAPESVKFPETQAPFDTDDVEKSCVPERCLVMAVPPFQAMLDPRVVAPVVVLKVPLLPEKSIEVLPDEVAPLITGDVRVFEERVCASSRFTTFRFVPLSPYSRSFAVES
jgi:hypothetical protein